MLIIVNVSEGGIPDIRGCIFDATRTDYIQSNGGTCDPPH
jgi:hypothetical protein